MNSLEEGACGGSTSLRDDSTVRLEWLEALVKEVEETDISSSQEEEEFGFIWLFHACLLESFQVEREFAWRYHQLNGVVEVATVFPPQSSVIFSIISLFIFPSLF